MPILLLKTLMSTAAPKIECITATTHTNDFIKVFGSNSPIEDANTKNTIDYFQCVPLKQCEPQGASPHYIEDANTVLHLIYDTLNAGCSAEVVV